MRARVELDGVAHEVVVDAAGVTVDGTRFAAEPAGVVDLGAGTYTAGGQTHRFALLEFARHDTASATGGGAARVRPPMSGKLERMVAVAGAQVRKGDVLFVLEAMKMQNEVRSPVAGRIAAVHGTPGATVEPGTVLVEIQPA